jgi:hypothetical protein
MSGNSDALMYRLVTVTLVPLLLLLRWRRIQIFSPKLYSSLHSNYFNVYCVIIFFYIARHHTEGYFIRTDNIQPQTEI